VRRVRWIGGENHEGEQGTFIVADVQNISCISFRFRRGRAHSGRLSTSWKEPEGVLVLILKTPVGCWSRVMEVAEFVSSDEVELPASKWVAASGALE